MACWQCMCANMMLHHSVSVQKEDVYSHPYLEFQDVHSLLSAITQTILDVLDLFCRRKNVSLGINGNSESNINCPVCTETVSLPLLMHWEYMLITALLWGTSGAILHHLHILPSNYTDPLSTQKYLDACIHYIGSFNMI